MTAMEKVAWIQLMVSVAAVALAVALIPWLGPRSTSAFALLALIAFSVVLLRKRGTQVVVDERDQAIERRATAVGVGSAWMTLTTVLIAVSLWANYTHVHAVSSGVLNWLIWIQFAICFGVKGLVAVVLYRSQRHAA